jgi:hypothetical protein
VENSPRFSFSDPLHIVPIDRPSKGGASDATILFEEDRLTIAKGIYHCNLCFERSPGSEPTVEIQIATSATPSDDTSIGMEIDLEGSSPVVILAFVFEVAADGRVLITIKNKTTMERVVVTAVDFVKIDNLESDGVMPIEFPRFPTLQPVEAEEPAASPVSSRMLYFQGPAPREPVRLTSGDAASFPEIELIFVPEDMAIYAGADARMWLFYLPAGILKDPYDAQKAVATNRLTYLHPLATTSKPQLAGVNAEAPARPTGSATGDVELVIEAVSRLSKRTEYLTNAVDSVKSEIADIVRPLEKEVATIKAILPNLLNSMSSANAASASVAGLESQQDEIEALKSAVLDLKCRLEVMSNG